MIQVLNRPTLDSESSEPAIILNLSHFIIVSPRRPEPDESRQDIHLPAIYTGQTFDFLENRQFFQLKSLSARQAQQTQAIGTALLQGSACCTAAGRRVQRANQATEGPRLHTGPFRA